MIPSGMASRRVEDRDDSAKANTISAMAPPQFNAATVQYAQPEPNSKNNMS
jgi:hypothetical protein